MALIFTGIVGSKTIIRTASTKLNINVRLSFFSQQLSPCTSSLLMIQLSCRWLLTSFRASFLSCSCLINSASLIFICSSIILLVSFICTTVSSWFKIKNQIFKKMCLGAYSLWTVWCHKCDFLTSQNLSDHVHYWSIEYAVCFLYFKGLSATHNISNQYFY